MDIRPATSEDVEAIEQVAARSWRNDYADILTRETADAAANDWYEAERILAELGYERTLVLVAERGGSVLGFAHATWEEGGAGMEGPEGPAGHILRIYVDPDRRREGVGRALLERTCETLAEEGVDRVNAMVLAANEPGRTFYERFGFEYAEEGETVIGGETYPERRYVLTDPSL
jgi:ribosomal protein S18 acetylase RimI-like enzyme